MAAKKAADKVGPLPAKKGKSERQTEKRAGRTIELAAYAAGIRLRQLQLFAVDYPATGKLSEADVSWLDGGLERFKTALEQFELLLPTLRDQTKYAFDAVAAGRQSLGHTKPSKHLAKHLTNLEAAMNVVIAASLKHVSSADQWFRLGRLVCDPEIRPRDFRTKEPEWVGEKATSIGKAKQIRKLIDEVGVTYADVFPEPSWDGTDRVAWCDESRYPLWWHVEKGLARMREANGCYASLPKPPQIDFNYLGLHFDPATDEFWRDGLDARLRISKLTDPYTVMLHLCNKQGEPASADELSNAISRTTIPADIYPLLSRLKRQLIVLGLSIASKRYRLIERSQSDVS